MIRRRRKDKLLHGLVLLLEEAAPGQPWVLWFMDPDLRPDRIEVGPATGSDRNLLAVLAAICLGSGRGLSRAQAGQVLSALGASMSQSSGPRQRRSFLTLLGKKD